MRYIKLYSNDKTKGNSNQLKKVYDNDFSGFTFFKNVL